MDKNAGVEKIKIGHSVLRKPNFKTKNNHFGIVNNAKNCKMGPFGLSENTICCRISKKLKGGHFGRH